MQSSLRVIMAQQDMLVGDIPRNTQAVIETAAKARDEFQADVIVFPELTLTGYPPEDLLLRPSLSLRIEQALELLEREIHDIHVVVGYPRHINGRLYNMAAVLYNGQWLGEYAKQKLPNYQVFDEVRYFEPGQDACVVNIQGIPVGLTVCEDVWHDEPARKAAEAGARVLLNLNASPFHANKGAERRELIARRCQAAQLPIVYVNQFGGQDELVFDGGSFVMDAQGQVQVQAPAFTDGLYPVDFLVVDGDCVPQKGEVTPDLTVEASLYQALVTGVREYVNKNGFKGVIMGLSGGIDSGLSLAIAVDALGPDRVEAVMMPFRYTSSMSIEDAEQEARTLGVNYRVLSIESMYDAFMETLAEEFEGLPRDTTEENLQARCRGILLMAISNKKGLMVLSTGNKSEMSVGYATLYGDMCGGYNALKDVYKTMVFRLARYRNTLSPAIPQRVIDRPPSAELAPDQKDEDSLPPYDVLDQILELYIDKDLSAHAIEQRGFDPADVYRVARLVDVNEYKRRQAPVGVRISQRGFGRDRRYPITNGWHIGE